MPPVNGRKLLLENLSNDEVFVFCIFQTVLHVNNKNLFYFYFFPQALDHFGKHPFWVLVGCLLLSCIKFMPFVKAV